MTESSPCIVAGYDGSPAARAALELAVARVGDGRLIVVHASRPPVEHFGEPADPGRLQREVPGARARARDLPEEVAGLGSVNWSYEVVDGPPADAIVDTAALENATEIVIGTRGRGRAGSMLGSVAHAVLHRASCPVLVVPERAVRRTAA